MDRPTRGPEKSTDRNSPATGQGAPAGDPWSEALQALQSAAQGPPQAAARRQPSAGGQQAQIDDALDALQILAQRHRQPLPGAEDYDPFPRRPAVQASQATADLDRAQPSDSDRVADEDEDWVEEGAPRKRWSRWGSPALVIVSAAVLAILLVGAFSLTRRIFPPEAQAPAQTQTQAPTQTAPAEIAAGAPVPIPVTPAGGTADIPTIEKAMSDCDDDAARDPDGLYFVVLPVRSPLKNYQPWVRVSVGEIGTSVILLRSKDSLGGLKDGSLTLYGKSYTFSIIDAATETKHVWSPVTGVAKFFQRNNAGKVESFRVRFGFGDFVGDTPSDFRFPRQKGVCYWVSALLLE